MREKKHHLEGHSHRERGILFFPGHGRFHWWLLWVCGWANASDAVEVLCVSFLLPAAQCDLSLTSSDKGWLSAVVFIGETRENLKSLDHINCRLVHCNLQPLKAI